VLQEQKVAACFALFLQVSRNCTCLETDHRTLALFPSKNTLRRRITSPNAVRHLLHVVSLDLKLRARVRASLANPLAHLLRPRGHCFPSEPSQRDLGVATEIAATGKHGFESPPRCSIDRSYCHHIRLLLAAPFYAAIPRPSLLQHHIKKRSSRQCDSRCK